MRFIWVLIRSFFVLIGVIVVAIIAMGVVAFRDQLEPKLPDQMVLAYSLNGTPRDLPANPTWMTQFAGAEPVLAEVTAAITRAATDNRVTALAVQMGTGDYDWADVQELQSAIQVFKDSGKPTYVYADSYGDLYPGMAEYYLATAFDEIWMQPIGTVAITGFQVEVPYFKKTLERLGINPQIEKRGDYKTAPEPAMLEHMSEPQRETLHGILASMMTDFFDAVSKARGLPTDRVGQLIDGAPYTADEAKERMLIDVVGYQDELIQKLIPNADKRDQDLVNLIDYYDATSSDLMKTVRQKDMPRLGESKLDKASKGKNAVALVYVTGMIVPGTAGDQGAFDSQSALADDIAWGIYDAAEDDDVSAIVIRVDSPGGSPQASETIRRAIEVAKDHGKYVVVSMGSEAASGGYWIVVDADRIYAQPGTLTGSIGVFGGKPDLSEMWSKLDVNWDSVKLGANAGMWSPNHAYDEEGWAATGRIMDDIYASFIARVAKGRNFSDDVVEGMAGGRVWTGRQAKERGLIDELGGLDTALIDVANHMGVTRDELDIFVLPDQPNPLQEVFGWLNGSAKIFSNFNWLIGAFVRESHPSWTLTYQQNPLR